MLLGSELEIIKFELHALAGDAQIRLHRGKPALKLRVEPLHYCLALRPFVDILRQRTLDADRFTLSVAAYLPVIYSLAALPQHAPKFAKTPEQRGKIALLHILAGTQAKALQLRRRYLADARDLAKRQRAQKHRHLFRRDHILPVGLVEIGGDLGEEFDRRDTRRRGELEFVENRLADLFGHQRGRAVTVRAVGDIQIRFVERERFNQRGIAREYFPDMGRRFFIGVKTPRQQREMRAELERHRGGHGATHAIFTRRIIGGADNAASFAAATDGERNIAQGWIIAHLYRREKAVHIDMNDFAHRHAPHCMSIQSGKKWGRRQPSLFRHNCVNSRGRKEVKQNLIVNAAGSACEK